MNIPNFLTILRIFFVPLVVAALVQEDLFSVRFGTVLITNEWLALAFFLTAAATDLLDGYLARRWKQVTTIGTLLDPIADKLLISAALIALVEVRAVPGWIVILIVAREFAVSGLRSIAAAEGYTIKASDLGKTKMIAQVAAVSVLLLSLRHPPAAPPGHDSDLGRGVLRDSFGVELLPQVLAQGGYPYQKAAAPRTPDYGKTPQAVRPAPSEGSGGERFGGRHDLDTSGRELNHAHLAARAERRDRFAVQLDIDPAGIAHHQPNLVHCGQVLLFIGLQGARVDHPAVGAGRKPRWAPGP